MSAAIQLQELCRAYGRKLIAQRDELLREAICRAMGGQCVLRPDDIASRANCKIWPDGYREYEWDGAVVLAESGTAPRITFTMFPKQREKMPQ